jgi:hypothetical protein
VLSQEWTTRLEKVTATSSVDILIPVSDEVEVATAAGRLRTARQYIRDGSFKAVASELRQALDRAMAVNLLADVSGKVHRLAADRRAEQI